MKAHLERRCVISVVTVYNDINEARAFIYEAALINIFGEENLSVDVEVEERMYFK